jgi:hypothetical protein
LLLDTGLAGKKPHTPEQTSVIAANYCNIAIQQQQPRRCVGCRPAALDPSPNSWRLNQVACRCGHHRRVCFLLVLACLRAVACFFRLSRDLPCDIIVALFPSFRLRFVQRRAISPFSSFSQSINPLAAMSEAEPLPAPEQSAAEQALIADIVAAAAEVRTLKGEGKDITAALATLQEAKAAFKAATGAEYVAEECFCCWSGLACSCCVLGMDSCHSSCPPRVCAPRHRCRARHGPRRLPHLCARCRAAPGNKSSTAASQHALVALLLMMLLLSCFFFFSFSFFLFTFLSSFS